MNLLGIILSAFAGMLITALLSPLFSERIIRIYSQLGLFQPNLTVNASITKSFYDEEIPVDKFDGVEWNTNDEIFRLKLKNQGNIPIYNVRLSLFFPGFVRAVTTSSSGANDISIESPQNNIELFHHQAQNTIKPCSQKPQIGQIDEHGEVLFEFLINTDTSSNGAYAFWNPTKEIKGSLSWEARGVRIQGQFTETVEDNVGVYDDTNDPEDLKITMSEYPFPDSNPELTLGVLDDPTENPLYEKHKNKIENTDPNHD